MGRFRAAHPEGSRYITPQGARTLKAELDHLWRVERPRVTQAVSEAAAQGDRSENAEYTYGKRRLREIDRRVRFLRNRLQNLTIVDRAPDDASRVFFGAWVRLESAEGSEFHYRIVGPDEISAAHSFISMDSPLGRALLGKRVDDKVVVPLPEGQRILTVVAINYEDQL